jgi:transcriptional regulator with XRE-family HTH domain
VARRKSSSLNDRLGKNIAARRKTLGLTQEQLAEHLGVDTETVSRIERGVTSPSLATLERISIALATKMAALLGEESMTPPGHSVIVAFLVDRMKPKDRAFVLQFVQWYASRQS